MMKSLKSGIVYFILVFGAGFVLGSIRNFWAVSRFGERAAELMEMPIMLIVIFFTARWIVRHYALPPKLPIRLGMGLIGLSLVLLLEFTLILLLRGLTLTEYVATRDPVAGAAYYFMLGVFAVMPLLVERKQDKGTKEN